jgi:hypothetical protein
MQTLTYAGTLTPMSIFERLGRQILEIEEVTTGASSLSWGASATTEKIAPVKSWNKFRKMQAPVPS